MNTEYVIEWWTEAISAETSQEAIAVAIALAREQAPGVGTWAVVSIERAPTPTGSRPRWAINLEGTEDEEMTDEIRSEIRSWIPTHEITIEQTRSPYRREQVLVMLCEDIPGEGGPAYTIDEWMRADNASWGRDEVGEWTWEGQPTPGGRTDVAVSVRVPKYLAAEAERVREAYAARNNEDE